MHVCSCCGGFGKFRDWLERTSSKWPVLCRQWHKTLTQSINQFEPSCHVFLERPISPVPALPPLSYSALPSQRHLYVLLSKPSRYSLLNHRDWFHNSPCLTWRGRACFIKWCMYCTADTQRPFGVNEPAAGVGRSTLLRWEETCPAGCHWLLRSNLPHPCAVWRLSSLTPLLHARINNCFVDCLWFDDTYCLSLWTTVCWEMAVNNFGDMI